MDAEVPPCDRLVLAITSDGSIRYFIDDAPKVSKPGTPRSDRWYGRAFSAPSPETNPAIEDQADSARSSTPRR